MKIFFSIALMFVAFATTAQSKMKIDWERMGTPHPPMPFYMSPYIWWDDSTVTYLPMPTSGYWHDSTIDSHRLYMQLNFLINDDLETHRRLDSLISVLRLDTLNQYHSSDYGMWHAGRNKAAPLSTH